MDPISIHEALRKTPHLTTTIKSNSTTHYNPFNIHNAIIHLNNILLHLLLKYPQDQNSNEKNSQESRENTQKLKLFGVFLFLFEKILIHNFKPKI